jgi:hypothetical protein
LQRDFRPGKQAWLVLREEPMAKSGRADEPIVFDTDKIDDAVLALLYLTLHDGWRAWKGFDWEALGRLYEKGMIGDPVGKVKSVVFTDEGLQRSQELFMTMFTKRT